MHDTQTKAVKVLEVKNMPQYTFTATKFSYWNIKSKVLLLHSKFKKKGIVLIQWRKLVYCGHKQQ